MAQTMATALDEAAAMGLLDPVSGAVKDWPTPAPSTGTTVDLMRLMASLAPQLARRSGGSLADAEDALQECLARAVEDQHALLTEAPTMWGAYLRTYGRYELAGELARRRAARLKLGGGLFSTEAGWTEDFAPDRQQASPLETGTQFGIPSLSPEKRSRKKGITKEWTQREIVGAIQAFASKHGRPPTCKESIEDPRLPNWLTAAKYFGSWAKAIAAAGFEPRTRRGKWTDVEAATACYGYFRRTGGWPDDVEQQFNPDIPPSSACKRIFGSYSRKAMIEGCQRILSDPAAADAAERKRDKPKGSNVRTAAHYAERVKEWAGKHGRWPGKRDFSTAGNGLPSANVALRVFGSREREKVGLAVETILAGAAGDQAVSA